MMKTICILATAALASAEYKIDAKSYSEEDCTGTVLNEFTVENPYTLPRYTVRSV